MIARLLLILCIIVLPGAATSAPRTAAEASAVDAAFVAALAALDSGAPRQAIPVFLNILAAYPDLVRVRLELGRAYFADRQWANARREFLLALSADLPDPVRRNVLRFVREIDARRGFDWSLSVSLAELRGGEDFRTDSIDLNFGGITLPFTLNRSDEKELGLTFSASASLRTDLPALNGPAFTTGGFGEVFTFGDYAQNPALRDISYGARAGLRFGAARTTSSIALSANRRDVGAQHFEDRTALELGFERRGATGLSVFGTSSYVYIDNVSRDTLDGHAIFAELGLRQSIDGFALIGLAVFGEARRTDFEFEAYDRVGLTVFGSVEARFGLSIRPSVTLAQKDFLAPNPLFADNPDERDLSGRLRVEKTDLIIGSGFSPFAEFEVRAVTSGIDAFSYTSRDLRVGLRRIF
jgi:hypothetical protein